MKKLTHPGIPSPKPKGRMLQKETKYFLNSLSLKVKEAKNKTTIRAFTLVELIVVITILAILGMIAFISLQGYSADARDSSRISDINHIKTSLELQSLAAGKYPLPDNSQEVTYSGGIVVWHQGTVGENVTKILSRNLNEKPTDPLYNTEYIYSVTPTQNQFEVLSIYEGDIVLSSPRPLGEGVGVRANASSNTVRIDGTYNGVYVKNGNYIIPTPSVITSLNPTGLELNTTTIKSQVIDRGTNIPNIGTSKVTQSTGALTFSNFQVYNGDLNEESSTGSFLSAYQAIANTYNGSSLASDGVIKILLTQTTDEQKIEFTKSLILSTTTGGSSGTDTGTTPTYSCTGTLPTQNVSTSNNTGLSADTPRQNTSSGDDCYYECSGGYTGESCDIEPLTGWRSLDSNCQIDDIVVGTQTWAGCNSTLGTGFERGKQDNGTNGTIGSCFNYDGANNTANCSIGGVNMLSTASAKTFFDTMQSDGSNQFGDSETENIWGKLYTWVNVSSACPTGWHVPTETEMVTLENYLNGTTCRTGDGWECGCSGWQSNGLCTTDRKLIETLKIPLGGYRETDGINFYSRGEYAMLWTNNNNSPYCRHISRNLSAVARGSANSARGLSVRCLKD